MGQNGQQQVEHADVVFTPTKAVRLTGAKGEYLALTLPADQGGEASCFENATDINGLKLFDHIENMVAQGIPFAAHVARKGQNKRVNGPYQNIESVDGFEVPGADGHNVPETHGKPLPPRPAAAPAPAPAAAPAAAAQRQTVGRLAGLPEGSLQYVFHQSEASLRAQVYATTAELVKVGLVTAEVGAFEKALRSGEAYVFEGKGPSSGQTS